MGRRWFTGSVILFFFLSITFTQRALFRKIRVDLTLICWSGVLYSQLRLFYAVWT